VALLDIVLVGPGPPQELEELAADTGTGDAHLTR